MVKTRTVEMQTQLVGYEFKKKGLPTDKNIAVENSKVSNADLIAFLIIQNHLIITAFRYMI